MHCGYMCVCVEKEGGESRDAEPEMPRLSVPGGPLIFFRSIRGRLGSQSETGSPLPSARPPSLAPAVPDSGASRAHPVRANSAVVGRSQPRAPAHGSPTSSTSSDDERALPER